MSILKVARMGHPVLRERARPLEKKDLRDRCCKSSSTT
jgi:hypothetical protein